MPKRRVLMLLSEYPTLSQTYKENEIKYLYADCEVRIASFIKDGAVYKTYFPYERVTKYSEVERIITEFRPDVVHGHYLNTTSILYRAAKAADIPFTVRSHSYDILRLGVDAIRKYLPFINDDLCAGFLAFPFLREKLLQSGLKEEKIADAWPVVDFARFYDRAPNGTGIMNTGACLPKKNMESFIDLAEMMPEREFSLYPIGYFTDQVKAYNDARSCPVDFKETVEPCDMPSIYKAQEWLVYSGTQKVPTVGWPIAIAEAQAAGVGVLMYRVRSDLEEYVGEAGYLFETLDEAKEILSQHFPAKKRELGFEQAKKSDIKVNIKQLHELWDRALA